MTRFLGKTFLIVISLLPIPSPGQEITEPDLVVSMFNKLYSFDFRDAKIKLDQLDTKATDPDLLDICTSNYNWWLIATQKEYEIYKKEMISSCDRIIDRYEEIPIKDLNPDQIFAITHAYAYKTRLDMHEKHYLKGAANLKETVKYLDVILPRAEENPKFMLLAGLYNYVAGAIHERYPIYRPLLALGPDKNKQKGIQLLLKCAENEHPMIRTEARYFIMIVNNLLEEDNDEADRYARLLLKEFPTNKHFRSLRVTILADAGKIHKTRSEYKKLHPYSKLEQHSQAQHSYIVSETEDYLRKKRIKF